MRTKRDLYSRVRRFAVTVCYPSVFSLPALPSRAPVWSPSLGEATFAAGYALRVWQPPDCWTLDYCYAIG